VYLQILNSELYSKSEELDLSRQVQPNAESQIKQLKKQELQKYVPLNKKLFETASYLKITFSGNLGQSRQPSSSEQFSQCSEHVKLFDGGTEGITGFVGSITLGSGKQS
jgi:hypothetical protein